MNKQRAVSLILITGALAVGLNNFTKDLSPLLLACNTAGFGIFLILWAKLLRDIRRSDKNLQRAVALILITGALAVGLNNFTKDLSPLLLACNMAGFGIFLILWAKLLKDIRRNTENNK
ncbi:MAG: hypothetical protein Q3988_04065 [Gemella sp.]|nr:hypothetical protein [Gemella sp.]